MKVKATTWWAVLAGLLAVAVVVAPLLLAQGAAGLAQGLAIGAGLLGLVWAYLGMWWWRSLRWVKWAAAVLGGSNLVGLVVWGLWQNGSQAWAIGLAGAWGMGLFFALGVLLLRILLSGSHPIIGVARTLVDEAIRMKVALVFIVGLAVLVPILPLLMDSRELLNYRIKTFLSWSMSGTGVLLSLMTVFLAAGTICNEIRQKQIYLTFSKPIGRGQYLLGKWLGIALLNLWLLSAAGGGIYVFAKVLQAQQAVDVVDRATVDYEVMSARRSVEAAMPATMNFEELFNQRLEQLRRENPDRYGSKEQPRELSQADENSIRSVILTRWYTVPPMGVQTYVFSGLQNAKAMGVPVQLRMKPRAPQPPADGKVKLALAINGRPWPLSPEGMPMQLDVVHDQFSVIPLPVELVNEQGVLEISVAHVNLAEPGLTPATSVNFTPGEGLELLYRVGGFEMNLVRGMTLIWWQLSFLAMLGLAAGTFLGFPVACLLCMLVYLVGSGSAFLGEAVGFYGATAPDNAGLWEKIVWWPMSFIGHIMQGKPWDSVKMLIGGLGRLVLYALPALGKFSPSALVADGRWIAGEMVGRAGLSLGLLGSGLTGLIGWWILRRRELATATQ